MFFQRQRILLAKLETEYGSDPTPTILANAIDCANIQTSFAGEVLERNLLRGSRGQVAPIIGKRAIEVSFSCELKNGGTKGAAPQLSALLQACGFSEGASVGSSVLYKPTNTGHKSITIYVYEIPETGSAILKKVTGARGNVSLRLEAGQIAGLDFSFRGKYNASADVTAPATPTYESTKPPIVESSSFTYNEVTTLAVQSVSIDMGNELVEDDNINSANGIAGFTITGRKPSGSFNPEAVNVATVDWEGLWIAATEATMSFVVGSAAGNKVTISCPKVNIENIADGDRNGRLVRDIPFRVNYENGDDDIQFKFE
jgi:hypothetical protein